MKRFPQPVPAVPRQTVSRSCAKVEKENRRQRKNLTQPEDRPHRWACRSFLPGKSGPERLRCLVRKKNAPGVRRTCFILYNRPSPVKLRMILHLFIPSLFHQRMRPWKSRRTVIWSNSRRRRKRSERPLESRCRLRQNQQKTHSRPEKIHRGIPESPGSLLRTAPPADCARTVRPH